MTETENNPPQNAYGFIMLKRNNQFLYLLEKRNTAVCLALLIAFRVKRTTEYGNPDLQIGEACIGDHDTYGVTEQVYKTDKSYLKKYGIATFRATSKGTIARLISTDFFNINLEQITDTSTTDKQTFNDPSTTNNNDKNENIKSRLEEPLEESQESPSYNRHPSQDLELSEAYKKYLKQRKELGI